MNSPLISIITPCFNAAPYIKDAIESVLSQTYRNFEFILVNDGSLDNTEQIIQSYSDERIRYFKQPNQGQCKASNFGLSKSKGSYIKFFDADDLMNSKHLEEQLKKINGCSEAIVSCAWARFYDGKPESAIFIPETVWMSMDPMTWIKKALSQKSDMMGACIWLIPREILLKAGVWNEKLSLNNDFEFSMRLILNSKYIYFADEAKLFYRSGIKSLSTSKSHQSYMDAFVATKLGCGYLLGIANSSDTRLLCANRYQQWIYRIFPLYPDLVNLFQDEINELGGSNIKMEGGFIFKTLSYICGWRSIKKLKILLEHKIGYKKLPFN